MGCRRFIACLCRPPSRSAPPRRAARRRRRGLRRRPARQRHRHRDHQPGAAAPAAAARRGADALRQPAAGAGRCNSYQREENRRVQTALNYFGFPAGAGRRGDGRPIRAPPWPVPGVPRLSGDRRADGAREAVPDLLLRARARRRPAGRADHGASRPGDPRPAARLPAGAARRRRRRRSPPPRRPVVPPAARAGAGAAPRRRQRRWSPAAVARPRTQWCRASCRPRRRPRSPASATA